MVGRARDAETQSFTCNLIVPNRFAVRMKEDVRVRVDQSRHQSHAAQFDHLRIGRCFDVICRTDSFDLVTAHEHDPVVMKLR